MFHVDGSQCEGPGCSHWSHTNKELSVKEMFDKITGRIGPFPENTLAIATVRGVPDVLVLRRTTGVGLDWAHTLTAGFTCSNDSEVVVDHVVRTY